MRLRPDRPAAIPASEPGRLRHRQAHDDPACSARRGVALLLGASVLVARRYDVRHAPLVPQARAASSCSICPPACSRAASRRPSASSCAPTSVRVSWCSPTWHTSCCPGLAGARVPAVAALLPLDDDGLPPAPIRGTASGAGTRISEGLKVGSEALRREGRPEEPWSSSATSRSCRTRCNGSLR